MASFCSGSSGSGSLTQMLATGALDAYLTGNASFTFWKTRYNKYSAFALESVGQPFNSSVSFGASSQIVLNRSGDMIFNMYAVIDLPGITACDASVDQCVGIGAGSQFPYQSQPCAPCAENDRAAVEAYVDDGFTEASETTKAQMLRAAKDRWARENYGACTSLECCDEAEDCPGALCPELNGVWAHWTNDIGQFLIRSARIVIGGSTIDTIHGEFLFAWEELTGKSGRRLTEMIGKRYTRSSLLMDSRARRTLYVPLPFWFTQHSGQALALASLQFHGVLVHLDFERLERCIVVSGPNVIVKNCATACCLTPNDLSACLETTYVYLSEAERDKFANTHFESLIIQHQAFHMQTNQSQVRLNLTFNHPVLEIIFAVRRQCHEKSNNWFNWSGIDGRDPIVSAALYLNNQSRFSKPGAWFRLVQPYQHHSNIPDAYIYVYSFALHPEDPAPSGSCNMSRIDHCDLNLQLQEGLGQEQVTVMVWARNWNILRFREGLAGVAFST